MQILFRSQKVLALMILKSCKLENNNKFSPKREANEELLRNKTTLKCQNKKLKMIQRVDK